MHLAAALRKPLSLEKGRKIVLSKGQPLVLVTSCCFCCSSSSSSVGHAHPFENTRQRSRCASCVPGVTQVPPPVEPPLLVLDQAQFWVVLFTCKRQESRVSRLEIRGGLIDQTFGCKLAGSATLIDGVGVPEERIQLLVGEISFRPLIAASFRSGRQRDGHKGARQGCQGGSGHLSRGAFCSRSSFRRRKNWNARIKGRTLKRQSA